MYRVVIALMACGTLSACGLGEVAITAAANGTSQAEQAKAAKQTEDRVKSQVDAAVQLDRQHRQDAENSAQ